MVGKDVTASQLIKENEELKLRLAEAEEALNAIRNGEVDAIVVAGKEGDKIFSISSSETPYRIILEQMDEGALSVGADGTILYCNKRFADMISTPLEKIVGSDCRSFIDDSEKAEFDRLLRSGLKGKSNGIIAFSKGRKSTIHLKLSFRSLPAGMAGDVCIIASDVSQLKEQQEKLEILVNKRTKEIQKANEKLKEDILEIEKSREAVYESKNKYIALYASMSEGLAIHELIYDNSGNAIDYYIIDVNPAFEQILGIKKNKAVGWKATEVFKVNEAPYLDIYSKVALNNEPQTFETFFPPLNKHFHVSVFSPERGKFATVFQDISERKHAEDKILNNEKLIKSVLDNVNSGVAMIDENGKFVVCNPLFLKLFGLSESASIKNVNDQNWAEWQVFNQDGTLLHVDEHPVRKAAMTGKHIDQQLVGVKLPSGGDIIWMLITAEPIIKNNGDIEKIICTYTDITDRRKAEEALRNSEERFSKAFRNSPNAITITRLSDGKIIDGNDSVYSILGYTHEEVVGKTTLELGIWTNPADRLKLSNALSSEGSIQNEDFVLNKKDGTHVPVNLSASLITIEREECFIASFIDLTERKKAEEALKNSERRYSALFANKINGMSHCKTIVDNLGQPVDYIILEINEAYERIIGIKKADIEGRRVTEVFPDIKNYALDYIRMYGKIALEGGEIKFEEIFEATGQILSIYAYSPVPGEFIAIFTDVTERKIMEEKLRESEERFRNLVKNAPTAIYEVDFRTRRFTSVNEAMCKLSGYTKEELLSMDSMELLEEEGKKLFISRISDNLNGKKTDENVEYKVKAKDGRMIDAVLNMKFTFNENGIPVAAMVVGHDITERKKAEKLLTESEKRFRIIAESLSVMVVIKRQSDSKVFFLNDSFEKSFGLQKQNIIGKKFPDIYFYLDDSKFLHDLLNVKGVVENMEIKVKKADGTPFWVLTSLRKITFNDEPSLLMTSIDISETKNAQEELLRLNHTLDAQSKSSQALMHATNETDYLNEICRIIIEDCGYKMIWVGYAQNDEFKSVKPVAYFGFDKGYIEQMNISWADNERGKGPTGAAIRKGKTSVCRNMLTDPCFGPWREAAIARGYASSLVLPLKSEGKAFGAISIYSKEPDAFTEPEIALLTEIADDLAYGIEFIRLSQYEKEATMAIKENEARLKELIATKDKFFNIIAHDLKNPFTSLLGASELLYDNIGQMTGENVKKLALILNDSAKGGYSILQNLLDWSRSQTGLLKFSPEYVNLKSIIDENIDNLQLQITNKEISLNSELKKDLFITADQNMINTILRNILSNAVKYTHKNGNIVVRIIQNHENITVSIKDTGIGMTKEKASSLFRLENSLSLPGTEKEQGTGLGLKLCKEFTEKMGGKIWVESKFGAGSEFKFTIPVKGVKA